MLMPMLKRSLKHVNKHIDSYFGCFSSKYRIVLSWVGGSVHKLCKNFWVDNSCMNLSKT
jgi:hypothetical protein